MLINRTTGSASVIPELVYGDVEQAIDWLCETFGFTELWRAGRHRARLEFGNGVVIIADDDPLHGRSAPKRRIWPGTAGPSPRRSPIWLPRTGAARRRQR